MRRDFWGLAAAGLGAISAISTGACLSAPDLTFEEASALPLDGSIQESGSDTRVDAAAPIEDAAPIDAAPDDAAPDVEAAAPYVNPCDPVIPPTPKAITCLGTVPCVGPKKVCMSEMADCQAHCNTTKRPVCCVTLDGGFQACAARPGGC